MMKKILLLTALLTLSACSLTGPGNTPAPDLALTQTSQAFQVQIAPPGTPTPSLNPADQLLSMDSSSESVQIKMLQSAATWKTIWFDGTITESVGGAEGVPERITRQQVWIDQPTARFRVLSGPVGGKAQKIKVSDGYSILEMDLPSGETRMQAMPSGVAGQFVPILTPGTASPNLIWSMIGEPLAELAFPSDMAQNAGTYQTLNLEKIAGRQTLAVNWTYINNQLPSWRLWLDVQTGVILKMQVFAKSGGTQVQTEEVMNQVQYDPAGLPEDLYSVAPPSMPDFSDVYGAALVAVPPGPTIQAGADPLGDVYFFVLKPGDDVQGARLVRLPASCIAGKQNCPEAEHIPLPDKTYANNGPALAWSADGKKVAFAADTGTGQARLFIADVPIQTWTQVAQYPYIDLPAWSPDGTWISFRSQDGNGNEDFYVVHPDGTNLKNVTTTGNLVAEDRPYAVDGWIADSLIIHPAQPGNGKSAFLLNVNTGQVRSLFVTAINKLTFSPSPDGSLLAFDQYDDISKTDTLRLIAPDGSGLRDLVTLKNAIYPVAWSPDGLRLAFAAYGNSSQSQIQSGIYVIDADGRALKQVYVSSSNISSGITTISFSPNGNFLLVEDVGTTHIFLIDLTDLKTSLLQAPGLYLTDFWRQPAWLP